MCGNIFICCHCCNHCFDCTVLIYFDLIIAYWVKHLVTLFQKVLYKVVIHAANIYFGKKKTKNPVHADDILK